MIPEVLRTITSFVTFNYVCVRYTLRVMKIT